MKTTFFTLALGLSLIVCSCQTEEISTQQTPAAADLSLDIESDVQFGQQESPEESFGSRSFTPCGTYPCISLVQIDTLDANLVSNYRLILIEYDSNLSESDIECTRAEYFNCFTELKMNMLQNPDPYFDAWRYPKSGVWPRTNKILDGSVNGDPRTSCQNC